jgi:outer membrane receptor for ferrienterochelin and colicins
LAVVHGRVIDAGTGAVVAGAQVLLTGPVAMAPAIHRDTLITDARGAWRSGRLSPGRYHLRVRAIAYVAREMELDVAAAESHHTTVLTAAVQPLERVVVTAARREQQLKDVAIATDIVSREDIERTGASDLASVLIEQTGIHLQGGHPAGAGVMLQGHGSERVLVLLDGQPMVGRISGVFDVSRIPTAAVERIEVVKGPQSTLYGSEAIGGVVNIITRTPPKNLLGASAEITAGTQERREGTVGITYGRGSIASSLDVSRRTTETTPGLAQTGGALAARTDVAAKLQWARDTVLSLEASVLALDERERWRTGTFYNFSDNVQWSGRMAAGWKLGRHRLTPTLFASVFDHRSRGSSEPKPIAGDTGQRQVQRLYQAELLYNVSLGEAAAHALDVGLTVRRDETETARVDGGVRSLTSVEPFAQLELAPTAALSVVPGVRVSHNTQWGTHVTPRLAARYHATESLTLRASAVHARSEPGCRLRGGRQPGSPPRDVA